jgi:hypothetical protein
VISTVSPRTPRLLAYSQADVIDPRISVPAQHALVRLSKNPVTSADAVGMVEEVKAGRLGGIFCVNWKTPAQRAVRFGKSWWTIIPPSEDAVLMLDPDGPPGAPPLIAIRRELDPDCGLRKDEKRFPASPGKLDAALMSAWAAYRLWRSGELRPCGPDGPIGTIPNVVPTSLCRLSVPPIPPVPPICTGALATNTALARWLQASLNKISGGGLPIDGKTGPATRTALRSFQQRQGLMPSGILDRSTQSALVTAGAFVPPCIIGSPGVTPTLPTPRGLKLLTHWHLPKALTGAAVAQAKFAVMTPGTMNPGFVDSQTGTALHNPALQRRLDDLLARIKREQRFKNYNVRVKAALVDLTGSKRFAPEFAGSRETESFPRNGSLPKIALLYALHQLRLDLEAFAQRRRAKTGTELIRAARGLWAIEGLDVSAQPAIEELFDFQTTGQNHVQVTVKPATRGLLCCVFKAREHCGNDAATALLHELGFPYISSVLWQSGLFSPMTGGLWLVVDYGWDSCFRKAKALRPLSDCEKRAAPFLNRDNPRRRTTGIKVSKPPTVAHNITPLAAATFFSLIAQGRLGSEGTSILIRRELRRACAIFKSLGFSPASSAQKCGVDKAKPNLFFHDATLIEQVRTGRPRLRYGAVLLTQTPDGNIDKRNEFFDAFIQGADRIIAGRN